MITEQLSVSARIAESHRRSIYQKIGISGAALVYEATRLTQSQQ